MAAAPTLPELVSVDEYISRFVLGGEKPSCEYDDGILSAKSVPSKNHSIAQGNLVFSIRSNYEHAFRALPELASRLAEKRFLIPDVAVEDRTNPIPGQYPGPDHPVPLCIEIKSPEDRLTKLFAKCDEYHSWGVPYCWIVDPDRRLAWEYFPSDEEPRRVELLTAGPIQIPVQTVFEGL